MNKEIKEILDKPKILMLSYGNYISLDDYVKLKNCITNLQEENKKLKSYMQDTYDSANDICGELQQRIDKAIEYIENHREAVDERNEKIIYWLTDDFDEEDILNILKGSEE